MQKVDWGVSTATPATWPAEQSELLRARGGILTLGLVLHLHLQHQVIDDQAHFVLRLRARVDPPALRLRGKGPVHLATSPTSRFNAGTTLLKSGGGTAGWVRVH